MLLEFVDDDICLSSNPFIAEVVHGTSSNETSVEGRRVTFSCEFKGRYLEGSYYGFKWMVTFQNGTTKVVQENDSNSDYYISTQQTFHDCHCHYFKIKLYVRATKSLNKARITCSANHMSSSKTPNSSYLSKLAIIYTRYVSIAAKVQQSNI